MKGSRADGGKASGVLRNGRVLAVLAMAGTAAAAQEAPSRPEPADTTNAAGLSARRLEELRDAARGYRIMLDTTPPRRLVLQAEPVLRWSNPLRKTSDGAVFLWVSNGRPEAVASLYRYKQGEIRCEDHEFQSLALAGLTADRNGAEVWSPRAAGVTLAPIPDAPTPGATAAERLRQMRTLAKRFKAFFDLPKDQSELRLLTKPLYRYEAHGTDLVDGALFAFVQTTDPEVLLLIEARPRDGALAWHYALARMSMVNLRADLNDRNVWRADWDNDIRAPDKPYVTLPASRAPTSDERGAADGTR